MVTWRSMVLLMEEILHLVMLVVYPIIYRVYYIQTVVGLGISEPSTVARAHFLSLPGGVSEKSKWGWSGSTGTGHVQRSILKICFHISIRSFLFESMEIIPNIVLYQQGLISFLDGFQVEMFLSFRAQFRSTAEMMKYAEMLWHRQKFPVSPSTVVGAFNLRSMLKMRLK